MWSSGRWSTGHGPHCDPFSGAPSPTFRL